MEEGIVAIELEEGGYHLKWLDVAIEKRLW